MIKIAMIRHGKTYGNTLGRYIGVTDEPLCEEGKKELEQRTMDTVELLFVSPLKRCLETADILYPYAKQVKIPEFAECNFGEFENKNYQELKDNPKYQEWIDSMATLAFPGGESPQQFKDRCIAGFDKMVETYGSCDLVMSNAGVQIVHPFEEYPFADWRKMMAIHADGAFLVSRAAYRRMKASGKGGRIVFTGSVQSFVGSKLKEPYNFAKHGVAGLAKAIAREGAEYGIYTYTICPSFIKTPLVEKQIPEQAASLVITEEEVVKNIMLRDTVDGVFTTVEDVANTLVFLSKDQGALTGQSLRLTHGWAMM